MPSILPATTIRATLIPIAWAAIRQIDSFQGLANCNTSELGRRDRPKDTVESAIGARTALTMTAFGLVSILLFPKNQVEESDAFALAGICGAKKARSTSS